MLFLNKKLFIEIPYSISKYGLVSGHAFLLGAIIAIYCKHYYLSILSVILYVTTMLYWRNVYHISYIKLVDMFMAHAVLLLVTVYYSIYYFKAKYRKMWYYFIVLLIIIYFINEYIYYCRTMKMTSEWKLLPLDYTDKYSPERKNEYYRVVYTHCLFLHIAPVTMYSYCALSSIL